MRRRATAESKPSLGESVRENAARLKAMSVLAKDFGGWRPALQVQRTVEAVPTQFLDYDIATGVEGHPISRVTLLHGPSANGKTEFAIGLGASFLARDHFFGLMDEEHTTPSPWLRSLMGDLANHPGFVALPCDNTYEQAQQQVREFCNRIAGARAKKQLPEDTTGIIVLDSIRKLFPKELMKRLMADLKKKDDDDKPKGGRQQKKPNGVDGYGGRAGQIKAALNAAWMDELVPLLADTRIALVIIARETDDPDAGFYDDGFKVGGGKALAYEASLRLRVEQRHIYEEGEDGKKRPVGESHVVGIHKSKVAGKMGRVVTSQFHTSNGTVRPAGFWRERDVFEVGKEMGVIEQKGSWYSFDGKRIGQGGDAVMERLQGEVDLMQAIEQAARLAARPQP